MPAGPAHGLPMLSQPAERKPDCRGRRESRGRPLDLRFAPSGVTDIGGGTAAPPDGDMRIRQKGGVKSKLLIKFK